MIKAQDVRDYAKKHRCTYAEAIKLLRSESRQLSTYFAYNPELIEVIPAQPKPVWRSARQQ